MRYLVCGALCALAMPVGARAGLTLDWSEVEWPSGSLSETFENVAGSGIDITITYSGDTDDLLDFTPEITAPGNGNAPEFALHTNLDEAGDEDPLLISILFSSPVTGVVVPIFDIDSNGATYDDFMTAQANGIGVPDRIVPSQFAQVVGDDGLVGIAEDIDQSGLSTFEFDGVSDEMMLSGGLTEIVITSGALNVPLARQHRFFIGSIGFVPAPATLSAPVAIALLASRRRR